MKKSALFLIVLAGVLWGTSGIFFNLLAPYGFTSFEMTAMRGIVSAVAFPIYALVTDRKIFRVSPVQLLAFAGNGIVVYATAALYYEAIKEASVSTAVILMYTAPVMVMAYSVAFLGEKINTKKVISVAMVIVGCALVSGIVGGFSASVLGVLLGLAAGILYSAYNIFTKIEMMKGYDSRSASMYGFVVMGICSACFISPAQMAEKASVNPAVVIPLMIGIGVCTCLVPYFLYTTALRDIPAGTASSLAIIEPMSATVFSIAFFGEQLSLPAVLGIVLILLAVYLLGKGDKTQ